MVQVESFIQCATYYGWSKKSETTKNPMSIIGIMEFYWEY
jgi:hypothetical protein